nr:palmitoleoyl-protein carboxylesterase notum1 [Crassostrea gigas]
MTKIYFIVTFWVCAIYDASSMARRLDMPLDVNKLESLGNTDTLMKSLKDIAQKSHNCGVKEIPKLRRHYLRNTSVTCNDGSRAGYYLRKSHGSKKWIIFLEGGWYCFDRFSCELRWSSKMRKYMTSNGWPEYKTGTGILSWDPKENPYYFNANIVYVPYCSSDSWTGTSLRNGDGYAFLGSYIIEEVIRDLIPRGLARGKKLFLTGTSAGGTGVLMNLDRVADLVKSLAPRVEVRGIADSGWFLDIPQFNEKTCTEPLSCSPTTGIKKGFDQWRGRVPEACKNEYPDQEQWRCYFGYRMYPTLKTPVFIVQYLFDEAQILANNLINQNKLMNYNGSNELLSKEQWEYLYKLGEKVKQTLDNVTAVFAPACLSHEVLLKKDWHSISVKGISLSQSIYCWENSFEGEKCISATNGSTSVKLIRPYGDAPVKARNQNKKSQRKKKKNKRRKDKNKRRRRRKNRNRKNKNKKNKKNKRKKNKKKKRKGKGKNRKKNRSQRSAKNVSNCSHHLIEQCPLPQWCNSFCPTFRNQYNGQEIDFFKVFAASGMDSKSMAELLGVNTSTVNAMNANTISTLLLDTFRQKRPQ